jgi:hypothetical protein
MGTIERPRAFDSQDFETIQWVYEAAWAEIAARNPSRDIGDDAERQHSLRKRVFALANSSPVDFEFLRDRVLGRD